MQVQQQAQGHSKAEQQKNLQQQQMAMHNQLMFQHSLLMQQYGMPAPMFPPVAGFPGSQTPQVTLPILSPLHAALHLDP